jgi:hypothetical protein
VGQCALREDLHPELAQLLADSGCIAISGGLEVASDRLLALMKKGVSVEQVARVTKGFADAGVLVHAYLMYGFPTQTLQDTVDALEYVRQLFDNGCIHSGFFHRFACTVHSPVGQHPEDYGITLLPLPEGQLRQERRRLHRPHRHRPRRPGPRPEEGDLQLHARHRPGRGRARLVRPPARQAAAAHRGRQRIAKALQSAA